MLTFKKAGLAIIVLIAAGSSFFAFHIPVRAQDLTPGERAALQVQYDELQKEIAAQEQIIKETQAKKGTLQGDVTTLNAQIKAAQAQIDAKNIAIKQLASQIVQKSAVIVTLSNRIEQGKESLASILRQTQMMDEYSAVSIALGAQDVSEFFSDLDAFASINTKLQSLFVAIQKTKTQTESEKAALAAKQNQTVDAKYIVVTQQQKISSDKTQKQQLLAITANQEIEYKKILADRQAKAAAIRAALFPLRDAGAITFGDALSYAKEAQAKTGVRPAFILAILTQESNLGANVGQCNLKNDATGAGIGVGVKNKDVFYAKVMKPSRDVQPFLDLGLRLGYDPYKQVVSCPIASAGGYGGAMGPAQFIPSTWTLYEDRTARVTGHATPNPWAAEDAIAAMSIYLSDLGAGAGGYTAEYTAAAKYYAGGSWATAGRGYGASVMSIAASIQTDKIDPLSI